MQSQPPKPIKNIYGQDVKEDFDKKGLTSEEIKNILEYSDLDDSTSDDEEQCPSWLGTEEEVACESEEVGEDDEAEVTFEGDETRGEQKGGNRW
ncbi:Hypothetical protein FKW44_011735 [Caligus rogercresseyi]|uniref:Uncharacterized protein n=1 Tax=Caligus rogercresseyi TaxID=217165 RepID=A0A7T8HIE6_CALRO|nr:Hypothetical protein FKW44_011735 [Caligus rogercresseyi]